MSGRYEAFASDVMMDMIRQLAKEARKGNMVMLERISSAVTVMEELYPDAKRELDDLYGKES